MARFFKKESVMGIFSIKLSIYRRLPAFNKKTYGKKRKGHRLDVRFDAPYVSQYGQDRVVHEILFPNKHDGFYVDIGANNGFTGSNTYFFEHQLNWSGVCIEPQPDIFAELQGNRKCELHQCCISDECGTMKFLKVSGANMLSGLANMLDDQHKNRIAKEEDKSIGSKIIDVECKTFADVLGDRMDIDFVSIDTEGSEMSILKSIDFSRYNIGCIAVENDYDNQEIYKLLRKLGYRLLLVVGDEIYVKESSFKNMKQFRKIQQALSSCL
jgi:FkbM family methyltransferase